MKEMLEWKTRDKYLRKIYSLANCFHPRQTCFCVLWACCLARSSWTPSALCSLEEHNPLSWTPVWGPHLVPPAIPQAPVLALDLLCLGTDHPETGPTAIREREGGKVIRFILCLMNISHQTVSFFI